MHCNVSRLKRKVVLSGVIAAALAWPPAVLAQNWFNPQPPASQDLTLAPPAPDVGDLFTRIDRLEEIVRRLNSEVESLRRRLGEGTQASAPVDPPPTAPQSLTWVSDEAQPQPLVEEGAPLSEPERARAIEPPTPLLPLPSPVVVSTANAVVPAARITVTGSAAPRFSDAQLPAPGQPSLLRGPQAGSDVEVAALPPGPADTQAENAYSDAYDRLIAEGMAGAGTAFSTFLKRYAGHELAGNAQYWMADTHFVRGEYTAAAREFLAGYKSYGSSPKAPESLLKLGLSLAALGRDEKACSSLREVAVRFPQAPTAVRERAAEEQVNAGC